MFGSKPAQINNNQSAPANNPFLDTNQVRTNLQIHYIIITIIVFSLMV